MSKTARSTKIALASALAASAIVPAVAVQAEEAAQTTSTQTGYADGKYTIEFTASNSLLSSVLPSPTTIEVKDGKFIFDFPISESMKKYIHSATVEGVNVFTGSSIRFEATELKTYNATADVTIPFGEKKDQRDTYTFTITPDAKTLKPVTAGGTGGGAPTTEAPATEKYYKQAKKFGKIVDGTYNVKVDAYKTLVDNVRVKDSEATGNYSSITNHLNADAKLVVENGKNFVELTIAEKSTSMVAGVIVTLKDGKDYKAEEKTVGTSKVYKFPIDEVGGLTDAQIHVVVPQANMDKWYPFGFAIETADLALPQTAPVYVYKDETSETSIMQGKYLTNEITYTEANGKYAVDLTFPEGQYVNDFLFEGKSVAEKSSTVNGNNTVKVYTVTVDSLTEIYDATIDLSVAAGPVNYNAKHTVQLQFGGKKNPFTDIVKLSNYGKIVSLYSEGIYKENAKFNPYGKVNRSQFALMLQRALTFDVPAGDSKFADVNSIKDAETKNAIKALATQGVINGLPNGTFNPYGEIRRDQAAQMIYRVLTAAGYKASSLASPFADTAALSAEAKTAIAELNKLGIMTGSQGNFNPKNTLTRDQMSKVLANTLQVIDTLK